MLFTLTDKTYFTIFKIKKKLNDNIPKNKKKERLQLPLQSLMQ